MPEHTEAEKRKNREAAIIAKKRKNRGKRRSLLK